MFFVSPWCFTAVFTNHSIFSADFSFVLFKGFKGLFSCISVLQKCIITIIKHFTVNYNQQSRIGLSTYRVVSNARRRLVAIETPRTLLTTAGLLGQKPSASFLEQIYWSVCVWSIKFDCDLAESENWRWQKITKTKCIHLCKSTL